jgi:hypothetical protein
VSDRAAKQARRAKRKAGQRRERTRRFKARCRDCRVDTLNMPGGGGYYLHEWYMVHGDVWAEAGMAALGGFLCVDCLERRLGRPLEREDLTDVELNRLSSSDTPRLRAIKVAVSR